MRRSKKLTLKHGDQIILSVIAWENAVKVLSYLLDMRWDENLRD